MRWLRFIPLFLISVPVFGNTQKNTPIYNFSKGLDTYHSSLSLPDGFVQSSLNGFFDAQAPFQKRSGYTTAFNKNKYAFQNTWSYTDPTNTSWIIVRASDSIIANNLTGSASVVIATVSVNNLVGETNASGDAYFVDQTQGVYYWDGTKTTFVVGSPMGSLIAQFHGRVWVSGAAAPFGNQLYGSKYLDGTVWGIGVNPNDPVQLTVGLSDNSDTISALYVFLDTLYTFKHFSTYALYGFDQTSFQVSYITQECGCIDQGTIQTFNHGLDFVSERGVEFFDGYTCTRISDPVKNLVDPAIHTGGGFSQQSWVQSSPADWAAGTLSPAGNLSTSTATPGLSVTTGTFVENSSAQWSSGTANNVTIYASSVVLTVNNLGNITNNDFELPFSGNWIGGLCSQVTTATGFGGCTITPFSGSFFSVCNVAGSGAHFQIIDAVTSGLLDDDSPYTTNDCAWRQRTITDPNIKGRRVKIQMVNPSVDQTVTSDSYIFGGSISYYFSANNSNGAFDLIQNGSSTITMGTFTSQVYDTHATSTWVSGSISSYFDTNAISFDLQSSPNGSAPWTDIAQSPNASYPAFEFLRYVATFTVTSADQFANTGLTNTTLTWSGSPGYFRSQIHQIGPVNSFGNFAVTDSLNGGDIAFSLCSSNNSNMSGATCTVQVPNSQINLSTGPYVQWYSTFTVSIAGQLPTLNSVSLQFFSGSRFPPMTSTVWDNRYWLGLTTTTVDAQNDAVLVLGTSGSWSLLDLHVGGLTQFKNSLYGSDSMASGNVYLENSGTTDNGNPINTYLVTKDFKSGDLNADNYFNSVYMSMDDLGGSFCGGTIYYFLDHQEASPFTLSTINQSEFSNTIALKVPFALGTNQNFGHTIAFKYQENDNCSLNLYGFSPYYFERPIQ